MKKHDKIAYRLAIILTKLNSGEKIKIDDLAVEFNINKRTVQRDLNERFCYLPIKKVNGYYFLEEYCVGKLNYNDIRIFATLSGIKKLYPTLDNNFIVDLLNEKVNKNYIVKGYEYEDLSSKSKQFELINIAILTNRKIKFKYKNKIRKVSPYKLANINGIWYLVADEENVLKNYTFSKITMLSITTENFKPNIDFLKIIKQNKSTWFSQKLMKVTLQIDKTVSEYFLRRKLLPGQQILEKSEKFIIVSTEITHDEEILRVVKYWIPYIKIIKPKSLQNKLQISLKKYLNNFDN